jgi:TolB-like protein/tRNA A-37 threonylcarbamoyl transferase component Bud32
VITKDRRACALCNTALPDNIDFCPVCALRAGLAAEQTVSESAITSHPVSCHNGFEHYEILTRDDGRPFELGRGAMGVTYKAIDANLRRSVALKVINAKFIGNELANRRLVREARAAAGVHHPNVAAVFHLGKSGDSYFYAMEFVDGESLDSVIGRCGGLDSFNALSVTAQVAAGLEAIAEQGLVHRDLKPGNIVVSLDAGKIVRAKIIDLGLAKGTTLEKDSVSDVSIVGAFAGTPLYASPEQFSGIDADIRSDLYSLGITLWEMLAGETPFHGPFSKLSYQHQHAPLPLALLTHVPQPLIALLEVLLEKDPAQRFQSPTELVAAIPRVSEAVRAGRSITPDQFRSGEDRATIASEQTIRLFCAGSAGTRIGLLRRATELIVATVGLLFLWFFFSGYGGPFLGNRGAGTVSMVEKSVAVLPFEDLSANRDNAYFADGVQDEILNNLAKIAQLKVISRTSVMQYRSDARRGLRQIAEALNVGTVLEGTVRRNGNRVRVSTELIDAKNDKTIWADSYDRDLTDIFAIQSQIAQTIAGKLTATLSPDEKKRIEARPTDNLEAYDLYLRAKELTMNARLCAALGAGVEAPLRDAVSLLEQAVLLDPKFALAYCEAAHAHGLLYRFHDPTSERRALGDSAIDHAMRLQPDLPEVHLACAIHLYFSYRDYERARVQLEIAERDLANSVEVFLLEARIDRREGRFEKAIQEFNEALGRDPRNPVSMSDLATTLVITRQFPAAEKIYDQLTALEPDQSMLKVQKAFNVNFMKTGDRSAFRSAVATLPASMVEDRELLSLRLNFALYDRDWSQAKGIIQDMKDGEDNGYFAYAALPVPVGCYSILLSRLQGEQPDASSEFANTREQLDQKVLKSPGSADLLSQLAVVDALLGKTETAITEAKQAAEMLPISDDAVDGPPLLINLAVVYAWSNEIDLAFETLEPLVKIPSGVFYGSLKLDPLWDPLRKDPRFHKLLTELAGLD